MARFEVEVRDTTSRDWTKIEPNEIVEADSVTMGNNWIVFSSGLEQSLMRAFRADVLISVKRLNG